MEYEELQVRIPPHAMREAAPDRTQQHVSEAAGSAQAVLRLQRQIGNRAVQRMIARQETEDAPPAVEHEIQQARGQGQALDGGVKIQMESALGTKFDGVRVHTNRTSDQLNQSLNARAFTTGQDIFFSQGAYSPGSSGGRELLAHELTHVVQQHGGEIMTKLKVNVPGDPYEQEADEVARSVMRQEGSDEEKRQQVIDGVDRRRSGEMETEEE